VYLYFDLKKIKKEYLNEELDDELLSEEISFTFDTDLINKINQRDLCFEAIEKQKADIDYLNKKNDILYLRKEALKTLLKTKIKELDDIKYEKESIKPTKVPLEFDEFIMSIIIFKLFEYSLVKEDFETILMGIFINRILFNI
jgi:hypothetical protein